MEIKKEKMRQSFIACVLKYKESMQYSRRETSKIRRAFYGLKHFGFRYLLYTLTRFKLPLFGDTQARLFFGKKIVLPSDDIGAHALSMYGIIPHGSERKLTEWIIKNLSESDVFYDVGAHLRFYTALAGEMSEVHSFEANSKLCQYLKKNFLRVSCMAVASSSGVVDFYDATHTSDSSESSRFNTTGIHSKVSAITLDEYVQQGNRPPTVIKFDIEGGEYDAILGTLNIINKNKPHIILEVWGGEMGRKYSDAAVKKLQELGYSAFALGRDGSVTPTSVSDPVGSISDVRSPRDNFLFIAIDATVV